jgi:hypothetical protein
VLFKVRNGALGERDVKNEGCSSEFIENKGAKKSAPQSLLKTHRLDCFHDELLKGKEVNRGVRFQVSGTGFGVRGEGGKAGSADG